MKEALLSNENIIETWEAIYIAPDNSSYLSKITITDKRILIKPGKNMSVASLAASLLVITTLDGSYTINKDQIKQVELSKSFFSNKCIVTLTDGSKHIFDKRLLKIDKFAEQIKMDTNAI